MQCTLLIPDLLLPRQFGAEPYAGVRPASLETLLARGHTVARPALAAEAWLCDRFNVPRQQDHPVAPLMLKADGGEPGSHYWLCADPVQLRVDRNRLLITGRTADFSALEALELVAALNRHFSADGLEFCAPVPSRWYVRAACTPRLVTTPLTQALNRSVEHHLPAGDDAMVWHRVMNEAQMIMHTHPVSVEREAHGGAVANSIWLWGGGTLPTTSLPAFGAMWGGDFLTHALATAAGVSHGDLPANGASWMETAADSHHLVVIDALAAALRASDAIAWRERLAAVDEQWIAPLLAALQTKRMSSLTLLACNHENLLETVISGRDLSRFWRRKRPLAAYAANA